MTQYCRGSVAPGFAPRPPHSRAAPRAVACRAAQHRRPAAAQMAPQWRLGGQKKGRQDGVTALGSRVLVGASLLAPRARRPGWMAGAPGASGTPRDSGTPADGPLVRLTGTRAQPGSPREAPLAGQAATVGWARQLLGSQRRLVFRAGPSGAKQAAGCAG
eukprot:CAMPEP_0204447956 /NCGR_PEP_ID=MMETSP0470-20130426/97542_1 /ASSEMBLY_ACC=CAM_ASM_000385 /TAXON_ID=2969 /ORGANISM="Oxyrrhis marina" /LENGTH=159 /DNA_ID=CAMNT_0051447667 /DNA_START=206 /DNA_END=685 /DNA_ORIENTATION=-